MDYDGNILCACLGCLADREVEAGDSSASDKRPNNKVHRFIIFEEPPEIEPEDPPSCSSSDIDEVEAEAARIAEEAEAMKSIDFSEPSSCYMRLNPPSDPPSETEFEALFG